jgi:hypothetical protein
MELFTSKHGNYRYVSTAVHCVFKKYCYICLLCFNSNTLIFVTDSQLLFKVQFYKGLASLCQACLQISDNGESGWQWQILWFTRI